MTGDLELEVRSAKTVEELKEAMVKMAEAIEIVEIDSRLDKVEDRLRNLDKVEDRLRNVEDSL